MSASINLHHIVLDKTEVDILSGGTATIEINTDKRVCLNLFFPNIDEAHNFAVKLMALCARKQTRKILQDIQEMV